MSNPGWFRHWTTQAAFLPALKDRVSPRRLMNGDAKALISAPQLVRQFFERLASQAQNYLGEVKEIVG